MMTDNTMTPLVDQIQASTDGDFLRAIAAHTLQRLMEFEVDGLISAGPRERSDERTTYRNGYLSRRALMRGSTRHQWPFPRHVHRDWRGWRTHAV